MVQKRDKAYIIAQDPSAITSLGGKTQGVRLNIIDDKDTDV